MPMHVYAIAHDITQVDELSAFEEEIRRTGSWWHCLEGVWILGSSDDMEQLRLRLARHVGARFRLPVIEIGGVPWSAHNFTVAHYA